jgi:tripartite-type tricarboxylate transporter receptor subunit TctC
MKTSARFRDSEMLTRRDTLISILGCAGSLVAGPTFAQGEKYPSRLIKLIVPYPAGSSGDIIARLLGQKLSERIGQPTVIENRPGGAGIAGEKAVAAAEPDGYTLLLTGLNHVTNVGLFTSLPFDTENDFTPISLVGSVDLVLVAHPSTGFTSAKDLIEAAKKQPGKVNFASAGIGTGGHLAMELFARTAGISMVHIPYKGATPALSDVFAGHVQVLFTGVPPTIGFINDKKLNGLLVGGKKRAAMLPEIPTAQEIGMQGFYVDVWYGVLGPASLPKPIVDLLSGYIQDIIKDAAFAQKLVEQGISPAGSSPEDLAALIKSDLERWPKFIREIGVKVE